MICFCRATTEPRLSVLQQCRLAVHCIKNILFGFGFCCVLLIFTFGLLLRQAEHRLAIDLRPIRV